MKFLIKSEQTLLTELNAHFAAHPELYGRFGLAENAVLTALPADTKDVRFNDVFLEMYGGKLVLLEGEVQACHETFQSRYAARGDNPAFYENLTFPWQAFQEMALDNTDPLTYVIGFIHRFDTVNSRWWLSAQRFTCGVYAGPGNYNLTNTNTLFDLPSNGDVRPYSGGLLQGGGSMYDPVYFNNVTFDQAPISNSTYANRLCYSWAELSQLFTENRAQFTDPDDSLFSINFCSISSDYSQEVPGTVLVPFPHCITMYMSYDGQALLGDGAIVSGLMFRNHAADLGTVCPSLCSSYTWPSGLSPL